MTSDEWQTVSMVLYAIVMFAVLGATVYVFTSNGDGGDDDDE